MKRESSVEFSRFGIKIMNMLEISHYVLQTKMLGPYVRSALWVHGCCFDCEGCLAKEMNNEIPTRLEADTLAKILAEAEGTEGITISGGEPFLQADRLVKVLKEIKSERSYGVILYTGYTIEELRSSSSESVKELLGMIDILIDGKYMESLDDGKPYRGSSNQRIIQLSDRYSDIFDEYYMSSDKRNIEINVTSNRVYMVGVPSQSGLIAWREFKKKAEGENDRS